MAEEQFNKTLTSVVVRVSGTGPLSFEVRPGSILTIKEIGPSSTSRPSIGGGFNSKGYLLFAGQTKVGRLSPAALVKLGERDISSCKVVTVDKTRKILLVEF
ncbi:MAG: hypothetical protein M3362_00120 [Acidobacteriota bacterium]|nr:hypothetical protein [Acidobacteriota bacterium]